MYLAALIILLYSSSEVLGSKCTDVSGVWQNQLGSNMTIIHQTANQITGEYSTAVETKKHAALITSNITGYFLPVENGSLLSFSVLFNHGKSLTTWVGQCMECDREETLFTTWVLRNHALKPTDKWMTNLINEDTFKRVRGNDIYIPLHMQTMGPAVKVERSLSCEKNLKAGLEGHWLSDGDDYLDVADCYESGVFSAENQGSKVFGRTDGGGLFTALGFGSANTKVKGSENIKGWAGHIYEDPSEKRTIETSWISNSFSHNCKSPRASTHYGLDNFSFQYGTKDSATLTTEPTWQERFLNFFHWF